MQGAKDVQTGWQYLPYQVYANSIFGDTVGQSYSSNGDLNTGLQAWQKSLVEYGNQQGFTSRRSSSDAGGRPRHPGAGHPRSAQPSPSSHTQERTPMPTFEIGDDDFLLDGQPFRIISGAIHYFRVHPDQWADRIRKARLMGLNTIETYVPWNLHEPKPGEWNWSGGADLARFLDPVAAEGMHAIVRPGPYICAEWDNGGLPAWLFADPAVGVRRDEPHFLAAVERYLERTLAIVEPRQIDAAAARSSSCRSRTSTAPTATTPATSGSSRRSPGPPGSPFR